MKEQDLTVTILVDKTAKEAFDAITNVRGWWSEEVNGGTEKLNDEFTYKFRDLHRCTMTLTEVTPNQKVVWLVLDNYFSFTEDQTEWKNTKVIFEISEQGDKTQVRFTHQGLVPQHECYEVCSNAWTGYITGSLYNLITTGKGEPNPKEN
jgi:predicted phosphohydrolase